MATRLRPLRTRHLTTVAASTVTSGGAVEIAWKVVALFVAAVACQYAIHRALDHVRDRRDSKRP